MTGDADSGSQGSRPTGRWPYRTITGSVTDTLSRYRVVKRLSAIFDVTLGPLALIAVCLLIAEFLIRLNSPWNLIVYGSQIAIWAIFLVAFVVELSLAPKKLLYVRRNWLLVIALFVPALRVLRAAQSLQFLRTARVVRGATVVRGFTSVGRAMEAIRSFLGFSQLAFLAVLTAIVWLAASGVVYFLESSSDSEINSVGDAMWWAASVLTTVGISIEPVTTEGRVVAIALRVFGVGIIGYFTARMAAFFLGRERFTGTSVTSDELSALREEMAGLRNELQSFRDSSEK